LDTLVDPVEIVSWSQVSAAPRVDAARASFQSIDPEAQVQWFARPHPIENEPSGSVEVDVSWDASWDVSGDEETDVDPTLVLRKRTRR
jgi:hypothetical protein